MYIRARDRTQILIHAKQVSPTCCLPAQICALFA